MDTMSHSAGNQRPGKDETAEYFFTYIDKVPDGDIVAALEQQSGEYAALLDRVSEEASHGRYAPGKWSVREVAGHVNDMERVFAYRALWFARGQPGPLPSVDQDVTVAFANSEAVTMAQLAAEFRAVRAATLAMVKTLPVEAWDRRGESGRSAESNGSAISVRAAIWIICGHVEHHTRLFREKYGLG
jgi:hypothetical protein